MFEVPECASTSARQYQGAALSRGVGAEGQPVHLEYLWSTKTATRNTWCAAPGIAPSFAAMMLEYERAPRPAIVRSVRKEPARASRLQSSILGAGRPRNLGPLLSHSSPQRRLT